MSILRKFSRSVVLVLGLLTLGLASPVLAQAPPPGAVDEKTGEVVRKVADFYSGLKTMTYEIEMNVLMEAQGQKQEESQKVRVAFERPNKLRTKVLEGEGADIVSDGTSSYMNLAMVDSYLEQPAAATFDEMFEDQEFLMMSGMMVSHTLLLADLYNEILDGVEKATYVGEETLGADKVHRIRFTQGEGEFDLWVDAGEKPLVRRIQLDMSKMYAEMGTGPDAPKVVITETYTAHDINPVFAPEVFQFIAPEGARKAGSLMEAFTGQSDVSSLKGKAAPAVKLPVLGGGELDLAALKGKVVVLDFWATWCPPCRKGLPGVAAVAKTYAEKGVVVYAVNLREDAETITEFLNGQGLKLNVAMDAEGTTAETYGIQSIPTTIIIGKDGVISEVHIGLPGDVEKTLSADIDAALAGP